MFAIIVLDNLPLLFNYIKIKKLIGKTEKSKNYLRKSKKWDRKSFFSTAISLVMVLFCSTASCPESRVKGMNKRMICTKMNLISFPGNNKIRFLQ